ncbi:MAG TPA: amidohydrolase [Xanthomonadales bacterium]|nr:amidohydrolase [Xanthomonadales bacterium]
MTPTKPLLSISLLLLLSGAAVADITQEQLDQAIAEVDAKVISWRRDIHQHPELSNRETRTAKLVADHLQALGLEVKTGIAHHGVTAVLRGGKPGPTIALRADMDANPVVEEVDLPFKSTQTAEYLGKTVGVMHACGHDVHTSNLMGVAEALASLRQDLPGTILFIFQPAEEGPPEGEDGGAGLMMKEGIFNEVKPEAVFGLHVFAGIPAGEIGYRSGPMMAAADMFKIEVVGKASHGSRPWSGVDPIVAAAQIVNGLQTIVSRQVDISKLPAVVTIGKIDGGVRSNIISDKVMMYGTMRTFDPAVRLDIIERMRRTAEDTASASGASATLTMDVYRYPVTVNDPALTQRVLPSLRRAAGDDRVVVRPLEMGAEDFPYYTENTPGFFFFVGVTPPDQDPTQAAVNHSPRFYVDETAIPVASRALANIAVDYLQGQ